MPDSTRIVYVLPPNHSNELNSVVRHRQSWACVAYSNCNCGLRHSMLGPIGKDCARSYNDTVTPELVNAMRCVDLCRFPFQEIEHTPKEADSIGHAVKEKKLRGDHRKLKRMRREHVTALGTPDVLFLFSSRQVPDVRLSHMSFSTSWHVPWSALITSTSIIDAPFPQQALLGPSAGWCTDYVRARQSENLRLFCYHGLIAQPSVVGASVLCLTGLRKLSV